MKLITKFLKDNWKVCLLCLFALLWMTKCTQSCNRAAENQTLERKIKSMESVLSSKDSSIYKLNMDLESTKNLLELQKSRADDFSGIASGNQKLLIQKIDKLNNKIRELLKENTILTERNNELMQQLYNVHDSLKTETIF